MKVLLVSCLLALPVLAALPVAESQTLAIPRAVFADATGAHAASLVIRNACASSSTLELTVETPLGPVTHVAAAKNVRAPDPCNIACLDCPVPFTWTFVGSGPLGPVALSGGGVVGLATSEIVLAGAFDGGVLAANFGRTTLVEISA